MLLVPGSITIRLHHRSKGAERMLSVAFSGFIERMKSLCNCCLYFDFDIDFMPFKMDCKGLELVSWSIQLSSHGKIILVHPDCVFFSASGDGTVSDYAPLRCLRPSAVPFWVSLLLFLSLPGDSSMGTWAAHKGPQDSVHQLPVLYK